MPRVGDTRREKLYTTEANYGNVISDGQRMPENGWITSFRVCYGGLEAPLTSKMCIWDRPGMELLYKSAVRTVPPGAKWHEESGISVPVHRGKNPVLGFWSDYRQRREFYADRAERDQQNRVLQVVTFTSEEDAPDPLGSGDQLDGTLCREFTYVAQERPLRPVFLDPTPLDDDVANLSLTVAGTLPHGDDAAHDHTERVQVRVVHRTTGGIFYNQWLEVEAGDTEFSVTLPELLDVNQRYTLMVRHQDTWGSNSDWRERKFTSSSGPDAPEVIGPLGRITAQKPAEFRFGYTNPLGGAYASTQLELWNQRRTSRLQASAYLVGTLSGTDRVISNTWMSNLAWGRTYWGRARHKDATGNIGGWRWFEFFTNAAPRVPFNLSPSGGRFTPNKILKARLADPDGDPITSVDYRVFRKSTNALVESGTMIIAADGKSATMPLGANVLTDIAYKWDARASDGSAPSPSPYSAQQEFTWAPVPDVSLLLPTDLTPRNLVEDPSFEYATSYWSAFATVAGVNEIARIEDAESYAGSWSLRGVVGDAAQSSPIRRSGFMAVDITRPYFFSARLMRELLQASSATHLAVECYNTAGSLLGTIYPGNWPQGADPGGGAWSDRDGFVGSLASGYAKQFPTNTTQVRIAFEPSRGVSSVVRLDAVYVRALSANLSAANAEAAKPWLGYFDGDTNSYRPGPDLLDFEWEIVTGASVSRGVNVLEYPQAALALSYLSPGNSLKSNDRMYIERLRRNDWRPLYDSGWGGGGRTLIPLPVGLLRSGLFYRVRLEARDSATTPRVGSTDWVYFQTDYQGPEGLQIMEATGSAETASLKLRWARTQINQLSFGGYEVAVAPYGTREPSSVLALIGNPENTEFEWHEPASGQDYYLMVRQIENVGAEQIQGDWSRAIAQLNFRQWFVKSLRDPGGMNIGFDLMAEDVVAIDYPAASTELDLWGASQPSYYTQDRDQGVGTVIIRLDRGDPQLEQKQAALWEIKRNRRFGCILLTTDPSRVYHMHLDTIAEEFSDLPWYSTWTLGLKQMYYEQDYYLREGVPVGGI